MNAPAATSTPCSIADLWRWLDQVCDPEISVLTVLDLGIVRRITVESNGKIWESTVGAKEHPEVQFNTKNAAVRIEITPTYTGCPAMNMIAANIRLELLAQGIENSSVSEVLDPAWTTDWMSDEAKEKLRAYGIAPPDSRNRVNKLLFSNALVTCPHCGSTHTEQISAFGSTACKSLYRCMDCREPFDYFKCH